MFVLFEPCVHFHIFLFKFGLYWEIAAHSAYDVFS